MEIVQVNYPKPASMAARYPYMVTDAVIHHSGGNPAQTPLEIDSEHRARGMSMIGYNYLIDPNGVVYSGRPVEFIPAAAFGRNTESVNICVLGNFEKDDPGYTGFPTQKQTLALTDLLIYVHHQLPSIVRTIGHRDVATMFYPNNTADYSTLCPGSELYNQLGAVRTVVSRHLTAL